MKKIYKIPEFKGWACRVHPFDWWHEVGCPDMKWTQEEIKKALANHYPKNDWKYKQLKKQLV